MANRLDKYLWDELQRKSKCSISKIFKGLPSSFEATRYHSLVIKNGTVPKNFRVISETIDNKKNVIMGIEHENYPCYGVQFHPESIASVPFGKKIMKNFLNL